MNSQRISKVLATVKLRIRSPLFQNVVANYFAVAWMGGLSIFLIPVYLRLLGAHEWGIVAVCMALQGVFGLLDAGLGQIMPRDIARAGNSQRAIAKVYGLFLRAYVLVAFAGFILGQLAIPWLLLHWLNLEPLQQLNSELPLRLVLVQFFFQFANSAHIGYWNGIQKQAKSSIRQCVFVTLKHMAAMSMLMTWRSESWVYLLGFCLVAGIEWSVNHWSIRSETRGVTTISLSDVRQLLREIGFLLLGVLVGMAATQMDRIILVKYVDVASFGRYVIVLNLGLAALQLQSPLMRAFFPKLAQNDAVTDKALNRKMLGAISLFCITPCLLLGVFAHWFLQTWLSDPLVALQCTLPLQMILMAVSVNAFYQLIYQRLLLLSLGHVIVLINLISLVAVLVFLLLAAPVYGVAAGGASWLVLTLVQIVAGVYFLQINQKKHLPV